MEQMPRNFLPIRKDCAHARVHTGSTEKIKVRNRAVEISAIALSILDWTTSQVATAIPMDGDTNNEEHRRAFIPVRGGNDPQNPDRTPPQPIGLHERIAIAAITERDGVEKASTDFNFEVNRDFAQPRPKTEEKEEKHINAIFKSDAPRESLQLRGTASLTSTVLGAPAFKNWGHYLQVLDLKGGQHIGSRSFMAIAYACKSLEYLNVSDSPKLRYMAQAELSIFRNAKKMTHLEMPKLLVLVANGNTRLEDVSINAPKLLRFELRGAIHLKTLDITAPKLRRIDLRDNSWFKPVHGKILMRRYPHLNKLWTDENPITGEFRSPSTATRKSRPVNARSNPALMDAYKLISTVSVSANAHSTTFFAMRDRCNAARESLPTDFTVENGMLEFLADWYNVEGIREAEWENILRRTTVEHPSSLDYDMDWD